MNAYGYIRDDVEDISKAFAGGHWTGERDSYPDEINEAVWGRVNAIGSQCPKKRCPHYHRCPFFLARALLESVDVVIANHDIVLSDLSLGGGIILPPQEESIYVFDEGHHVPQKAINHFATSASLDAQQAFHERNLRHGNDHARVLRRDYGKARAAAGGACGPCR